MFSGSFVALITPMHADGSLDFLALNRLLDFHLENNTHGIVIVGTTGESSTVSFKEHIKLIESTVRHVGGKIPVIAGTGANSTEEAVLLTQSAKDVGANACLLVTPYYNKPSQEGLYQHFATVAHKIDIPQILYNVPSRTGVDLHNETVLRLAKLPNIVGIKDATGDIERGIQLISQVADDFIVLSGDDGSATALMLMGARGVISVTANVVPRLMSEMSQLAITGNAKQASNINKNLVTLHQNLFIEANPIPVKWLLKEMGLIEEGIRLPLVSLSTCYWDIVRKSAQSAGITL